MIHTFYGDDQGIVVIIMKEDGIQEREIPKQRWRRTRYRKIGSTPIPSKTGNGRVKHTNLLQQF